MRQSEVVNTIQRDIGLNAAIVDVVVTTSDDNSAPQPLHSDHDYGARKLYKLVASLEGRSVDTEFGAERVPISAPT
jgi:hypothetical protein